MTESNPTPLARMLLRVIGSPTGRVLLPARIPWRPGRKAAGLRCGESVYKAGAAQARWALRHGSGGPAGEPKAAGLFQHGSCPKTHAGRPPARRGAACLTLLEQC